MPPTAIDSQRPLTEPVWSQQPGETSKAYAAFFACLNKGAARVIKDTWREVTGSEARNISGSWNRWAREWRWADRFDAYDRHQNEITEKAREQAAAEKHASDLEDFRRMHEHAGKASFNNVMLCSKILQESLQEMLSDPAKRPKTYSELKQLSGIIGDFMRYGPQVWADALGVPQLQAMLEAQDGPTQE